MQRWKVMTMQMDGHALLLTWSQCCQPILWLKHHDPVFVLLSLISLSNSIHLLLSGADDRGLGPLPWNSRIQIFNHCFHYYCCLPPPLFWRKFGSAPDLTFRITNKWKVQIDNKMVLMPCHRPRQTINSLSLNNNGLILDLLQTLFVLCNRKTTSWLM